MFLQEPSVLTPISTADLCHLLKTHSWTVVDNMTAISQMEGKNGALSSAKPKLKVVWVLLSLI